jgi:diadenosine tetraphosphate (Ap4A) HIT family hydrolase
MNESMEQLMEREMAEAIATLNKANRALDRLFGTQEGEDEE